MRLDWCVANLVDRDRGAERHGVKAHKGKQRDHRVRSEGGPGKSEPTYLGCILAFASTLSLSCLLHWGMLRRHKSARRTVCLHGH